MRTRTWLLGLAVGALSLAGCGTSAASRGGPQTSDAVPTQAATTAATPSTTSGTGVLFSDSFDDDRNGWGIVDDPVGGTTAYADGDYVWHFTGSVAHWLPAVLGDQYDRGELQMRDVVVRAELTIDAGRGVAGVGCRENKDTDADWQWYEFVVRDGFAAIRQSDVEGNIEVLADTDEVRLPLGQRFVLEGSCLGDAAGSARLAMLLDGRPILEATGADALDNGVPSLQAWTSPPHSPMDIRWHEFSVRAATA